MARQGRLEQAIRALERAADLLPEDGSARLMVAHALRKVGRTKEAEAYLSSAEEKNRKEKARALAKAINNEGTGLLQKGEYEAAGAKLREAVALDPNDAFRRQPFLPEAETPSVFFDPLNRRGG